MNALHRAASGLLLATVTSTCPAFDPSPPQKMMDAIGGMMSHAAIVCREYGLPAVTGTGNGSSKITTGQKIRVDGNTGKVTILD